MNSIVLSALLPVVGLITFGVLIGRTGWIAPRLYKLLSDLAFTVLTPALLFRTMSRVHLEQLDLKPAVAYIVTLVLVFGGMLLWRGVNRTSAVLALAVTYSNAVMIGIPLVTLAFGDVGLVTLLTLIPVHSLLLLTTATLVLEFALAHEQHADPSAASGRILRVTGQALRKSLLHPVPLPILAGLLFASTGLQLPGVLDSVLRAIGSLFGPLSLALVGMTLAGSATRAHWRGALWLAGLKNLAVPALAALLGIAVGLRGVSLSVLVVTAALPIGANVFVFSRRYGVAQELTTAAVAISTVLAALTVSITLLLLGSA